MRNFDFSPLYRNTVGFDHLSNLLDAVNRGDGNSNAYPPYNIELLDQDQYRITMAVAGFVDKELDIQCEKQTLTVKGKKLDEDVERNYLHQGIAGRNFERRFQLADHVEVKAAHLENGLLHIDLVREIPEAMKPRSISIGPGKLIDMDKTKAKGEREAA
ncbi:MAG TPA: heat-shock protein IbpA [Gammaproteobacteria bacterium]|nr:Hsp20 family protein [Gammaproteobacteria bacterium]MDP6731963.1 Hsp20 family protein [Gammaproteobacteria bacterium]HAJ75885.1 heat-shock protein IbpA [Gammaproteobacteria bacterium]